MVVLCRDTQGISALVRKLCWTSPAGLRGLGVQDVMSFTNEAYEGDDASHPPGAPLNGVLLLVHWTVCC